VDSSRHGLSVERGEGGGERETAAARGARKRCAYETASSACGTGDFVNRNPTHVDHWTVILRLIYISSCVNIISEYTTGCTTEG
jgi:hypothetical protein